MRAIFVRHGETLDAAKGIHQSAESGLSPLGVRQAQLLAQRLKGAKAARLISSNLVRALQTAQIISQELDLPVEENDLFRELRKCSEIVGRNRDDEMVKQINVEIKKNYHLKGWCYSDEETQEEFVERGLKAINFLEGLKLKEVIIVSHGIFMNLLLKLMLFGPEISDENYQRLSKFMRSTNTSISIFDYKKEKGWRLVSWNDHSHLASLGKLRS